MASAIRRGLSRLTSDDNVDKSTEPDAYRLLVTAGPSYDTKTHQIVPVNGDGCVTVSNEFMTAKVKVRVRGYRGLPSGSPADSVYFDDPVHSKDQYSVALSFVPKQDLPSVDTVWGNDFDHPIRDRLPPGFNTAFKIVKEFIDPGLACDAYADEPWLYGPSLSCWFAFRIGDMVKDGEDFAAPSDQDVLKDGADGSGKELREKLSLPENNEKRRKFFLNSANREKLVFEKGRLYQADFYNPYLDFGNLALKLPGFSIKVFKYIDAKSHCLRYVFKNRDTGDMYVNINFNLLWGDGLKAALEKEEQTAEKGDNVQQSAIERSEMGQDAQSKEKQQQEGQQKQQGQHAAEVRTETQPRNTEKQQVGEKQEQAQHGVETGKSAASTEESRQQSGGEKDSMPDEIARLLAETSTDDKRGGYTDILD